MSLDVADPDAVAARQPGRPRSVLALGRVLPVSAVFDTYWRFAAERQAAYLRRLAGAPAPWTSDPVIRAHRFTNCYRACDRVSQYLISRVIYGADQAPQEVVFRILLFKLFNRIETWEALECVVGVPTWRDYDSNRYSDVLAHITGQGRPIYSAAYVMPSPALGYARKYMNHLALLELMMRDGVAKRLQQAKTMREAFQILRKYPGLGDFLAFQYLIDINYSEVLDFSEMDFVVAGPGARSGLRKVFGEGSVGVEDYLIALFSDQQQEYLSSLDLSFEGLAGRPLQLIDCQNLFCEVDKYARVVHPEISGGTNRHRIKQRYLPSPKPCLAPMFPPKWGTGIRPSI
jgi:alpha-glutamyl/putrescinyl thymine pyrophosphorylase clade 1